MVPLYEGGVLNTGNVVKKVFVYINPSYFKWLDTAIARNNNANDLSYKNNKRLTIQILEEKIQRRIAL